MSRDCHYNPEEGEFVDFETLDDWRARDLAKNVEIEKLRAALALGLKLVEPFSGTHTDKFKSLASKALSKKDKT